MPTSNDEFYIEHKFNVKEEDKKSEIKKIKIAKNPKDKKELRKTKKIYLNKHKDAYGEIELARHFRN